MARERDFELVKNGRYAWYVTFVLLTAYTFSFIDRQVMNLLVEPVRQAFQLDDTKVSLLIGLAFVSAYALFSPAGGRLADVGRRRKVIIVSIVLWSLFTIACGLMESFWSLFAMRFAVGAAEACLMPACWSIIADCFTRDRLPRAMGFFLLGPYIGGGLALLLGGAVINGLVPPERVGLDGWQQAFIVAGLVGIVPMILTLTIREPRRTAEAQIGTEAPAMREVWRFLVSEKRFYGGFYSGAAFHMISFYALPAWMPTFIVRHFDVPLATIGFHYGLLTIVCGCLGVLSGPVIGRWLVARGYHDYNLRISASCGALMTPLAIAIPFVASYEAALAIIAAMTLLGSIPIPMNAAALQSVSPNRMRGITAAIYMAVVSLISVAIPPTVIGLLTDHVFRNPGMVGWSLGIVCFCASLGCAVTIALTLPGYRKALAGADVRAAA